jgi:hypothetical protein
MCSLFKRKKESEEDFDYEIGEEEIDPNIPKVKAVSPNIKSVYLWFRKNYLAARYVELDRNTREVIGGDKRPLLLYCERTREGFRDALSRLCEKLHEREINELEEVTSPNDLKEGDEMLDEMQLTKFGDAFYS